MSLLTRPSVVFAIVFGCFAVLLPRVFLPLFRRKSPVGPSRNFDEHFRRGPSIMSRNENGDRIQHIPGSPPHMRGPHPSMRMRHPGVNSHQQSISDHSDSKSIVTLALPMYTVGIGIFFIYTCCKYWSKKDDDEHKIKNRYLNRNNLRWYSKKRKHRYDLLDEDSEEEEDNKEDFYGELDPDYVEYLQAKKQKALDAEKAMTEEQRQMHHALEEMKKSLSFISSKLVQKENRDNLNSNDIIQLHERLALTEAQMCKILTVLDIASDKVNAITKNTNKNDKIEEKDSEVLKTCNENKHDVNQEELASMNEEDEAIEVENESDNELN